MDRFKPLTNSWLVAILLAVGAVGLTVYLNVATLCANQKDLRVSADNVSRQVSEQVSQQVSLKDRIQQAHNTIQTIGDRIKGLLHYIGPTPPPAVQIESLLMSEMVDPSVQVICVFDYTRSEPFGVARAGAQYPLTPADIPKFLDGNTSPTIRAEIPWKVDFTEASTALRTKISPDLSDEDVYVWLGTHHVGRDLVRGRIYVEVKLQAPVDEVQAATQPAVTSAEIQNTSDNRSTKKVLIATDATAAILILISLLAFSWRQKVGDERLKAEMAKQGIVAERGLTAAVLAHEIRNPLAALRFQLHSLRRNAADEGRVTTLSEMFDSELLRIQNLVNDYLAHERAQSMRSGPVDLLEAVKGVKALMDELLRASNTRLAIVDWPQDVVVFCDPHALRQILINLVINAQQAMGRGGTITIAVRSENSFGAVDVQDTGPGIPEEMRNRLFKPFQTSKKEGSGIGLALVKRFVDNFGGSVSVSSLPGEGTTFTILLPLHREEAPKEEAPARVAPQEALAPESHVV